MVSNNWRDDSRTIANIYTKNYISPQRDGLKSQLVLYKKSFNLFQKGRREAIYTQELNASEFWIKLNIVKRRHLYNLILEPSFNTSKGGRKHKLQPH